MLTDKQAEAIKQAVHSGTRGPVLIKFIDQLLEDRAERVARERARRPQPWPGPLGGPEIGSPRDLPPGEERFRKNAAG